MITTIVPIVARGTLHLARHNAQRVALELNTYASQAIHPARRQSLYNAKTALAVTRQAHGFATCAAGRCSCLCLESPRYLSGPRLTHRPDLWPALNVGK